ncbi:hypothetical protein [Hoeflea sp.]|uniref:hypothetical protein n=1 Tax=Hoeflea sp. TaxID=1940281 RepID=UPI003B51E861
MAILNVTGTASVTNGSTTVTIVGGNLVAAGVSAGIFFTEAGLGGAIASVTSDTELELALPYAGTTATGLDFTISIDSAVLPTTTENANRVAELLDQIDPLGSFTDFSNGLMENEDADEWRAAFGLSTPPPGGGDLNILVNGDFQINQRAFAGGSLSTGVYGFDRWKAVDGAASLSLSGYVATLASGVIAQVIEPSIAGVDSLASTTLTVSVEAPSADLTVTAGSTSGTIEAGAGRKSVTLTTGAGDTGNLTLKIAKSTAGSVSFGRVKAEVGSVMTAWSARPFPQEFTLCQRYFQTTVPYGQNPATYAPGAGNGSIYTNADTTNGSVTVIRYPAPMRTTPTITIRDGAANAGKISVYNGAWLNNYAFTGAYGSTDKGFSLQQNNSGVSAISFDYTVEAEL